MTLDASLIVVFEDDRFDLTEDRVLEFGRASELVIDAGNRLLHRLLGRFRFDGTVWWIDHLGTNSTFVISDHESSSLVRVAPGRSAAVPFARSSLTFAAGQANYRLALECSIPDPDVVNVSTLAPAEATITTNHVVFNDEQIDLLTQLAIHQRESSENDRMPTNRQLAASLGWSPSKLNRKLDHLCTKLTRVGVTGLQGSVADVAVDRKRILAQYAVDKGLGID